MTEQAGMRVIRLFGPAVAGQPSLWAGDFACLFVPSEVADGDGLVRHYSIRLQTVASARSRILWPGHFDEAYHQPGLFDAFVILDRAGSGVGAVTVLGVSEKFDMAAVGVRLRPVEDGHWPNKSTQEIETPDMRLLAGSLPLALAPGERNLCALFNMRPTGWRPGVPENIFGLGFKIAIDAQSRARATLTAGGVVFELELQDPFYGVVPGVSSQTHHIKALLYPLADTSKTPAAQKFRLRLIADDGLQRSFAAYLSALGVTDAPLFLDVAPGLPPLEWPVARGADGKLKADPNVMTLRADAIGATLLTGRPPGSAQRAAAALTPSGVTLVRRSDTPSLRLSIQTGAPPEPNRLRCDFRWDGAGGQVKLTALGVAPQPTSKPEELHAFAAVADTALLRERLLSRYVEGRLRAPDSIDPVYAFVPLQRGLLQAPLPWPSQPPAPAPKPIAREAITGFLHLESDDQGQRLDLTAAAHASVTAEVRPGGVTVAVSVGDFEATLTGPVRAAETVPADGEILPSLENGPTTSAALPLRIQAPDATGWNVVVDPISASAAPGLRIVGLTAPAPGIRYDADGKPTETGAPAAFVAWLAHPELALIAAISMTQLGSAAHRASRTRDLAPVEIAVDAANKPEAPLRLERAPGSLLPRLSSAGLGAKPHGWPAPNLAESLAEELTADVLPGVPLAALTLAGVELALPVTGDDRFAPLSASLRFDLPALGELFADAAVKQPKDDPAPTPNGAPPLAISALDPQGLAAAWGVQADKLARTRTILDRVTPWLARSGEVEISGLIEPFVWSAQFALQTRETEGPPLGTYQLGDRLYAGVEAVKGVSRSFTGAELAPGLGGETVHLVGMAAQARDIGDRFVDMRGLGVAKTPTRKGEAEWRDVRLEGSAGPARALTTLRVAFRGLSFEARDLPMVVTPDAASFAADLANGGDPEGRVGGDGRMFVRANLANGVGEWRLFETAPAGRPRFTVPLSPNWPLRLRPLRLLKAVFALSEGPATLRELTVVGSVELESAPGSSDMPFDDDEPYASGNLVAATYDAGGLIKLSAVHLDFRDEARIMVGADPPDIRLNTFAKVEQAAPGDATEQTASLNFKLGVAGGNLVWDGAVVRTRLFGQDCELRGGAFSTVSPDDFQLTLNFPMSGAANALNVASVTWGIRRGQARIDVTGAILLAADEGAPDTAGPALLTLAIGGGTHRWFGVDLPADADGCARVDHQRGVVVLNEASWPVASVAIVRGLAPPASSVHGGAALAVGDSGPLAIANEQAFVMPVAAGVAAFEAVDADAAVLRHTMLLRPNGARRAGCEARIRVSLPQTTLASSIDWPVDITAAPSNSPISPVTVTVSAARAWTDNVTMRFKDVELPAELLARDSSAAGSPLYLKQPWRTRISVLHEFKQGDVRRWAMESLDEVIVFDLGLLIEQSKIDLGRPSPHADVQRRAYAFSPRYKDEARLSASIAAAGVVERGLARAGFPTRVIQEALAAVVAPAQGAVVITGATLVEIAIQGQAGGVALPLPWIVGAEPAPALQIRQRPADGATRCRVSRMDADPRREYVGEAAEPIAAAGRSAVEIAALLAVGFGDAPPPFLVADQAFSTDGEDRPASLNGAAPAPPANYTRPLFWRAATAIAWIASRLQETPNLQLSAATLLGAPGHRSLGARLRVVAPIDAPAAPASADRTLYVIARGVLASMRIPLADEAAVATRPGEVDRLTAHAYAKTPAPLALLTAEPEADKRAPLTGAKVRLVRAEAAGTAPPLRDRLSWLPASPSLSWPQSRPDLAGAAIALGPEQPIQDSANAWSGRARALALPRKAQHNQSEPVYLAFGRKTLFRRPDRKNDATVAPPDLSLSLCPPRARAPRASAVVQAINEASPGTANLSAYLPGGVEVITTGARAGVLGVDHFGLIVPGTDELFDSGFARFGRPAHRGPTLVQHSRNPRSSGLPLTLKAIDARRRTFAAQNFVKDRELETFLLAAGAMTLLRYVFNPDPPGAAPELRAVALIVAPADAELGPGWNGEVKLSALAPKEGNVADVLATLGFRPAHGADPGAQVDLVVGVRRFAFEGMAADHGGFLLKLVKVQITAAQVALRDAGPQTPVRLAFRLAEERQGEHWPTDEAAGGLATIALASAADETVLRKAKARAFSLPLLLANGDGPKLSLPPRTIAFGDPAYDRELGSPTKSTALRSNAGDWLLAADRAEYDLGSTIYFAAGRVSPALGKPTAFEGGATLTFDVSVQPKSAPDQKDPPKLRRLQINGAAPSLTIESGEPVCFLISSLHEIKEDGTVGDPAALAPGDRLVLSVTPPAPENHTPLVLEVMLVDEPVLAAPAAAYGLVSLAAPTFAAAAVAPKDLHAETSLFATAPMPDVIEFPDLANDLAQGHVRRRALFLWRFASASPLKYASLVKLDRTGAAQTPDGMADFQSV